MCTAAALCRVASPVFEKNHFSQCNTDADCSIAGTTDPSRPPRLLCCDEVAQTWATYCDGAPQATVDAYMQRGGWISTRCGPKPDCVSQVVTTQTSTATATVTATPAPATSTLPVVNASATPTPVPA